MRGLRQDDHFAIKVWFLHIYEAIERRIFLTGNALTGVQHGVKGVARVVGKALTLGQRTGVEPFVEQKIDGGAKVHGGFRQERRPRVLRAGSKGCHQRDKKKCQKKCSHHCWGSIR